MTQQDFSSPCQRKGFVLVMTEADSQESRKDLFNALISLVLLIQHWLRIRKVVRLS